MLIRILEKYCSRTEVKKVKTLEYGIRHSLDKEVLLLYGSILAFLVFMESIAIGIHL